MLFNMAFCNSVVLVNVERRKIRTVLYFAGQDGAKVRTSMKVNAKLSLRLIKHHAKEAYAKSSGIASRILHLRNGH